MTLVSGIPKEFLSSYFMVTSNSAPGKISRLELFSLILAARDLLFVSILLASDSTIPLKLFSLFPENFISTFKPSFIKVANDNKYKKTYTNKNDLELM